MKNTLTALAVIALFASNTVYAQVNTIDSVATSKVQHFNFDEMESETIGEGIKRKWFHGEKGQMTIFDLEEGAHIPWHQHPNEQITYIMSGKVKIKTIIDGKEKFVIVSGGEVIVFPENVPHEFWALEKTVDLDVHVPVRQDWLSKELPDYLKKSE
ncbi:Cupin domain-containing protein [Zobellia uliginosa]|uniref:Cupin domain-containing protein n=1 Tax=Zobellia uliginosa TaxID=143224 RepID=A0ABY1KSS8_9FLAO|nr:cupin domain-containing protein [Zobellia uliginosa]SIS72564.1 Cupin domain-containing protein [Zobellia uliginosa]